MTSISSPAKRTLIALLAVSVALVIAALIAVAMRPTATLRDPSTPSGVVQRYLVAFQAQDIDTARQYVSDGEDRELCDMGGPRNDLQITLVREVQSEDTSTVTVEISYDYSGFMSLDGYSYPDYFELKRAGDTWLIEAMPWEVGMCTDEEMGY